MDTEKEEEELSLIEELKQCYLTERKEKIEHIKKYIVLIDTDNHWERYNEAKKVYKLFFENSLDDDEDNSKKYSNFIDEITDFLREKYDDFQQ